MRISINWVNIEMHFVPMAAAYYSVSSRWFGIRCCAICPKVSKNARLSIVADGGRVHGAVKILGEFEAGRPIDGGSLPRVLHLGLRRRKYKFRNRCKQVMMLQINSDQNARYS